MRWPQCCSSLICLEKDGAEELIILAHYSVRQFLLAHHQTENDTVELQLGGLCITHLHRHKPVRDLTRFQQANVPIQTGFFNCYFLASWRHGYFALALLSRSSQSSAYPFRQDQQAMFLTQKLFCSTQKSTGRH